MPSINDSGSEGTLRTAIALALGHRIIVEGGTAAAVIDLSYGPGDHQPPPPQRKRRRRKPRPAMPVLLGTASEDGRRLIVWCPFCGEHAHGRCGACEPGTCGCPLHLEYTTRGRCTCPVGAADGHRNAHCARNTPFSERGYYVQEIGS
jgi:hypothetical protein